MTHLGYLFYACILTITRPCQLASILITALHLFAVSGTSTSPCSSTYGGPFAASEKCVQNMQNKIMSIAPKVSLYMGVHSYSQMWLTPWAWGGNKPSDYSQLVSHLYFMFWDVVMHNQVQLEVRNMLHIQSCMYLDGVWKIWLHHFFAAIGQLKNYLKPRQDRGVCFIFGSMKTRNVRVAQNQKAPTITICCNPVWRRPSSI